MQPWGEYVRSVIGSARQVDVSERTGIDQTTISRWLSRPNQAERLSARSVAMFARAYDRPVIEAFMVAGFLTQEEADLRVREKTLDDFTVAEIAQHLARRLAN